MGKLHIIGMLRLAYIFLRSLRSHVAHLVIFCTDINTLQEKSVLGKEHALFHSNDRSHVRPRSAASNAEDMVGSTSDLMPTRNRNIWAYCKQKAGWAYSVRAIKAK